MAFLHRYFKQNICYATTIAKINEIVAESVLDDMPHFIYEEALDDYGWYYGCYGRNLYYKDGVDIKSTNAKGNIEHLATVQMNVKLIDSESGEWVLISGLGNGQDSGDKAVMKAETAALIKNDSDEIKDFNKLISAISHQERDIENICVKLLMQQQPVARDLRTISAALKMVTDMERIGIQSGDIAEIIEADYIKKNSQMDNLQRMAEEVINMVNKSIESFVKKDKDMASEIIASDDVVNGLFDTIKNEILAKLKQDKIDADCAVDMMMINKYPERIGDHAVNVAKWVIFSITGEIELID